MRRFSRGIDALVAGVVLAGIPVVLLATLGSPLSVVSGPRWLVRSAADLVWVLWAWCLVGVLLATVRRVHRRDLVAAASGRALDSLSLRLATLILALSGLLAPSGGASAASAATHRAQASTATVAAAPAQPAAPPSYLVQAGDCLWRIAEAHYGDGAEWVLIARANLGRVMSDGRVFIDPSLIQPGWELILPDAGATAAPPPAIATAPAPASTPASRMEVPVATDGRSAPAPEPATRAGDAAVVIAASLGASATLLGLLRRRRRRLGALGDEDEGLIDADVALAHLDPLPSTSLLERAALLALDDGVLERPGLLEVGEGGARFWVEGKERWSAPACDLVDGQEPAAAPGAVIPLGEEGSTSWSLLVPPGTTAAIDGPAAARTLEGALALQREFAWGHLVVSDEDALELAETGSLLIDQRSAPTPGVAGVVVAPGGEAHVSADRVELPELGRSLTPARLATSGEELLHAAPSVRPDPEECLADIAHIPLEGGAPRIRLLRAVPSIEGLEEPIEPRRERRAVELCAYLALHRPDPVTGDRLRSRVLGTSEADAAAKTLFNVASAARRALGVDHEGRALFPPASRLGHYQLSDAVGCDLDELCALVADARLAEDPELALAQLRAGLELIESEPLSAVLVGYEWLAAEGHLGRLEAAVEAAVALLVPLAIETGHLALADELLRRAILAVPYSEACAESAMELAAARGDLDGLTRAFEAMGRLAEELDPGSWPEPAAEDRFRTLRRRLLVGQASLAAMEAAPRNTRPSAPAAL